MARQVLTLFPASGVTPPFTEGYVWLHEQMLRVHAWSARATAVVWEKDDLPSRAEFMQLGLLASVIVGAGFLVVAGVLLVGKGYHVNQAAVHATTTFPFFESVGVVASASTSTQAVFSSQEFGFSISHPKSFVVEKSFSSYYHLPAHWRANVGTDSKGLPVVSIIAFRVENPTHYPRYFDAEVRIGASNDPEAIATCYSNAHERGPREVEINGETFQKFDMRDAAMMQYMQGESYRILRHGYCYAIEAIKTGSNYRDDPKASEDITDEKLESHYQSLGAIIQTFRFVGTPTGPAQSIKQYNSGVAGVVRTSTMQPLPIGMAFYHATDGALAGTVVSGINGAFAVALAPGTYRIRVGGGRCPEASAHVQKGQVTQVDISCTL
ncbi:MAG: hypothetical protein A2542_03635 [Parcubacteria group bacterium RIFOXYD2_FULL_52_8]|nr:MAG: hypothetical protein A2542_03635 [Parcubacteria group bacterium RIFOXYD2_FULL_52_8]